MEKKNKLTITLALAVLVITLSLGTAISIALNESDVQTTVPIQPEIAAPIQPEIEEAQVKEISIQPHTTVTGPIMVDSGVWQNIYTCLPGVACPKVDVTVTNSAGPAEMYVNIDNTVYIEKLYKGQSASFYGRPGRVTVGPAGVYPNMRAFGEYRVTYLGP